MATMFAPTSEPDAVEILRFAPLSENVQSTASWLHTLHHGPRYANPLVPDLLAERLIHQEATIEWIKRAIDPDLMLLDPYPLETLTRTIGTSDEFRSIVAPLFNGAVAEITERLCASPPLDDAQMLWHSRSLQQRRTWSNCHLHQCQHSPQQY